MRSWIAGMLAVSCGWSTASAQPGADPAGATVPLDEDLRAALTSYFEGDPLSQGREVQERTLAPIAAGLVRFVRERGEGQSLDDLLRRPDLMSDILRSWPRWETAPLGGQLFEETYLDQGEEWTYALHLPVGYRSGIDHPPLIVDLWSGDDPQAHFQEHWQGDPLLDVAILLLPPHLVGKRLSATVTPWQVYSFIMPPAYVGLLNLSIRTRLFQTRGIHEVPVLMESSLDLLLPAINEWSGASWEPLIAIKYFWDRFSLDEERILLSARGEESEEAARIAARFKDIFAGLMLWDGEVAEHYFAPNLAQMGVYAPAGGPLVDELERLEAPVVRRADLVSWVQETRIVRYPEQFEVVVPHPRWGDAYWIKVYDIEPIREARLGPQTSSEELPGVRVTLDRAANRILLETRRVRVLRIRLNDRLVDLDRPLSVVLVGAGRGSVNGGGDDLVVVEAAVERSLAVALENVWRTGERRRIFVNDLWVFVP